MGGPSIGPRTVDYYYADDLKAMNLPTWNPPDPIPLSPEQAVQVAVSHLQTNYPTIRKWDVDGVELKRQGSVWVYLVALTDRKSGKYEFETVRVLLNGSVWKPARQR